MLLAKIKENKIYFGKLVIVLGEAEVNSPPTYPLDPLEGVSRGNLLKNFPRGEGQPKF